jgi:hypothetical protein
MIIELAKHFLFYVKKKPTTHVEFVTWGGDKRNPCGCAVVGTCAGERPTCYLLGEQWAKEFTAQTRDLRQVEHKGDQWILRCVPCLQ